MSKNIKKVLTLGKNNAILTKRSGNRTKTSAGMKNFKKNLKKFLTKKRNCGIIKL